jgi:hypothetical protein
MDRPALWIEESATQELYGYIALVGGIDKSKDVENFEDYIYTWRICLWDKAFNSVFSGSNPCIKSFVFDKVKNGDLHVKRLYLMYEFIHFITFYLMSMVACGFVLL